jgi:PE family
MSSYVIAVPEAFAAVSGDLTGIEEAIKEAAAAAAPSTTGIAARLLMRCRRLSRVFSAAMPKSFRR